MRRNCAASGGPFGRICANVSGAMGQTIPFGVVGVVGRLSLSFRPRLRLTESVFLFDFCAQNVSFVSVTRLGGDGLRGKVLACDQGGAKRQLAVL